GEPSSDTSVATVQGSSLPVASPSPDPPGDDGDPLLHAVRANTAAAATLTPARNLLFLMGFLLIIFRWFPHTSWAIGGRGAVGDGFGPEVLCAFGCGVRGELVGGALFDDVAGGDEDDAVGGFPREAHLVGDDDHRHAVVGEGDHDVEHLVDHLRVEGARRL